MYIFFPRKLYDRKSVSFVTGEILFQVYLTLACAQKSNISFIARGKVPFLHNPVANHVLVSAAVSGIQFLRATKEIGDVCTQTDGSSPKKWREEGGGGEGARAYSVPLYSYGPGSPTKRLILNFLCLLAVEHKGN